MRTIEKASGQQAGSAASGTEPDPDPVCRPPASLIVHTDREPENRLKEFWPPALRTY